MISLDADWAVVYNSIVLTLILVSNVVLLSRFLWLDIKDRRARKKL